MLLGSQFFKPSDGIKHNLFFNLFLLIFSQKNIGFIIEYLTLYFRVNHSCCANASCAWEDETNEQSNCYELRAIAKIEVGEEICINYQSISLFMKNLQTRQDCLLVEWGFKCACVICLDEYLNDIQADEIYSRFETLQNEHETFGKPQNFVSFDITK